VRGSLLYLQGVWAHPPHLPPVRRTPPYLLGVERERGRKYINRYVSS